MNRSMQALVRPAPRLREMRVAASLAAFAAALIALASSPAHAEKLTGTATVIDGDTVEIHGVRVRFHGVDTPESSQECTRPDGKTWRCGQQAALALQDKIANRPVTCEGGERGKYGRLIGTCSVGKENLNAWLTENGWAMAYRKYSKEYVALEEAAHAKKLNIWNGSFTEPHVYRKQKKERDRAMGHTSTTEAPGECKIKGNISRSGKRIYHLPTSEWYAKTRIDTGAGEGWFCTEKDAQAAGFVAAKPSKDHKASGKRGHPGKKGKR